jgi:hypothetical protein
MPVGTALPLTLTASRTREGLARRGRARLPSATALQAPRAATAHRELTLPNSTIQRATTNRECAGNICD